MSLERREQRSSTLGLKIIALLISIAIWFYLKNQPQLEELRISYNVMKVPVNSAFRDELLTGRCYVETYPKYVDVAVKGRYLAIKRVSPETVKAYVEIPDWACTAAQEENQITEQVKVILPKGVDLINVRPRSVLVKVYPLVERTFQVRVKFIGQPARRMKLMGYFTEPRMVKVYGRKSDVSEVREVVATVSLDGLEFSTKVKVPLVALNEKGEPVDNVEISPSSVSVSLWIAR